MHVVVIGAGSVGQSYGYFLQRGGARVTYQVKPSHVESLRDGVVLYPWNRPAKQRPVPVQWKDYELVTSVEEALALQADVYCVATSATAMFGSAWFDQLCAGLGDATLVSLQPGTSVPEYVFARAPRDQVVWGLISLVAWPAPLPGQDLPEPGQGFWVPWGSKLGFSGPDARVAPLVQVMNAGGGPSTAREDIHADQAFAGPILANVVIPFELSGWSMRALSADRALLQLAISCMRESWARAERKTGKRTPLFQRTLGPGMLGFALRHILPLAPLDFEAFFRVHYTKIADQTPVLLAQRIADIQAAGLPTRNLEELQRRLLEKRETVGV